MSGVSQAVSDFLAPGSTDYPEPELYRCESCLAGWQRSGKVWSRHHKDWCELTNPHQIGL